MKRHVEIQISLAVCMLIALLLMPTVAFGQQSTDAAVSPAEATIVGGEAAGRTEFPWQAMLFNPNGMHVCSGSLIHTNWVLTAAHCLDEAGITTVALGGYNSSEINETGRQTFAVKRVIIHPNFRASNLTNDIGLIELDGTAVETEYVKVISIVGLNEAGLMEPGTNATVSGWGAQREGSWMTSTLNKVIVPLVARDVCAQAYGSLLRDGMTCAGYAEGGKDSCSGDSGGPLMVSDNKGGMKLAGVVSWGRGCARANAYGVYTNAPYFTQWIMEHLGGQDDNSNVPNQGNGNQNDNGKQNETVTSNQVFLPMIANQ